MPAPHELTPIDDGYHRTAQELVPYCNTDMLLAFCQHHHVEVFLESDLQYHCWVDGIGSWGVELDFYSALVMGIIMETAQFFNQPNLKKPPPPPPTPEQLAEQIRQFSTVFPDLTPKSNEQRS